MAIPGVSAYTILHTVAYPGAGGAVVYDGTTGNVGSAAYPLLRLPIAALMHQPAIIGRPQMFSLHHRELHLWPIPDKAYQVKLLVTDGATQYDQAWYDSYEAALGTAQQERLCRTP